MAETRATCSHEDATRLAAKEAVKATVLGRPAIVTASSWEPTAVTATGPEDRHFVRARAIRTDVRDVEAEGTPQADGPTQQIINDLAWEPWSDDEKTGHQRPSE
jgi:hypothetical protein